MATNTLSRIASVQPLANSGPPALRVRAVSFLCGAEKKQVIGLLVAR